MHLVCAYTHSEKCIIANCYHMRTVQPSVCTYVYTQCFSIMHLHSCVMMQSASCLLLVGHMTMTIPLAIGLWLSVSTDMGGRWGSASVYGDSLNVIHSPILHGE